MDSTEQSHANNEERDVCHGESESCCSTSANAKHKGWIKQEVVDVKLENDEFPTSYQDIPIEENEFQCVKEELCASDRWEETDVTVKSESLYFHQDSIDPGNQQVYNSALVNVVTSEILNNSDHLYASKGDQSYTSNDRKIPKPRKSEKKYPCNTCGKLFTNSSMDRHVRTHTGVKPYACSICDKTFNQKCDRQKHERIHTGEKPFACKVCDKRLTNSSDLRKHERIHTNERPCPCRASCGKSFKTSSERTSHERFHCPNRFIESEFNLQSKKAAPSYKIRKTPNKPYKRGVYGCEVCGKKYSGSESLKKHTCKTFKCLLCEQEFIDDTGLSKHAELHNASNPFRCKMCPKVYSRRGNLTVHERTHASEKPFACVTCGKRFNRKASKDDHEKSVHGNEKFICSLCEKEYISRTALGKHMFKIHAGNEPFKCKVCNKGFFKMHSLRVHESSNHPAEDVYRCSVCEKVCGNARILAKHSRVHSGEKPFACSVCERRFADQSNMRRHEERHSSSMSSHKHQCCVCNRRFYYKASLVIHNRRHTGEKPYICWICGNRFYDNSGLKTHVGKTHVEKGEPVVGPIPCKYCDRMFHSNLSKACHEMWHSRKKTYMCSVCGRGYFNKGVLRRHMKYLHKFRLRGRKPPRSNRVIVEDSVL